MKYCIDCECELTNENKSRHQPSIRCLECFGLFADGVSMVLSGKARDAQEAAATIKNRDGNRSNE